jgi:uncharacterized protein
MIYYQRILIKKIQAAMQRGKSVLLFGARQTGKTTLLKHLNPDVSISFIQHQIRRKYEINPSLLIKEIEAEAQSRQLKRKMIVALDEFQKVPEITDEVQDLIDRNIAIFILTGSSARKLKKSKKLNLLPGRVVSLKLDPLTLAEIPKEQQSLEQLLLFGALPGIFTLQKETNKETDLDSYVNTYLEEEIRAEALVRNLGLFSQFLALAAISSGEIVNFSKISQEIGQSLMTIKSYYEILEDCLIAERIEPLMKSKTRLKLTKSPKYLLFDLGIRRICAKEGTQLPLEYLGKLFEQFIGLEILRFKHLENHRINLKFWRDPDGPEVDWVIEKEGAYIPIEVKYTEVPKEKDIRHLKIFLTEYKNTKMGYVVCRAQRRLKLAENILAIPWQELLEILKG